MNKQKIFRLIFALSFLPYVILLIIALCHAIFGLAEYTWILPLYVGTIYGMDAFLDSLVWNGLKLCFIPVLPITAAYQVVFIIVTAVHAIQRKKQK